MNDYLMDQELTRAFKWKILWLGYASAGADTVGMIDGDGYWKYLGLNFFWLTNPNKYKN